MDNEKKGNASSILYAFLFGTLTGGILALLYSPLSGREIRKKVRNSPFVAKDKVHKAKASAKGTVEGLVDQGKSQIHETKDGLREAVEAGKEAFNRKKAEIADAIAHQDLVSDNSSKDEVIIGTNGDGNDDAVVESSEDSGDDVVESIEKVAGNGSENEEKPSNGTDDETESDKEETS